MCSPHFVWQHIRAIDVQSLSVSSTETLDASACTTDYTKLSDLRAFMVSSQTG